VPMNSPESASNRKSSAASAVSGSGKGRGSGSPSSRRWA
jgi:hypothetical protein